LPGPTSQLALDVYTYRIAGAIAAMATSLGGLDALVFTAGVGEHSGDVRAQVCARLGFLGVELDADANTAASPDAEIAAPGSPVRIVVLRARGSRRRVRRAIPARPPLSRSGRSLEAEPEVRLVAVGWPAGCRPDPGEGVFGDLRRSGDDFVPRLRRAPEARLRKQVLERLCAGVRLELDVALETSPERIEAAERAAEAGRGALPRQAWRSSPCTSPSPLAAKAIT
jgi:hypothetical protein